MINVPSPSHFCPLWPVQSATRLFNSSCYQSHVFCLLGFKRFVIKVQYKIHK